MACTTLKHGECINHEGGGNAPPPVVEYGNVNRNPGWDNVPEWKRNAPRSPIYKVWQGDAERDDIHMVIALALSGMAFVWVSERRYGKSKVVVSSGARLVLGLMAAFYLMHNVVIISHRYYFIGKPALYEGLWVCSMALPLASLGIFLQRYHLIAAALSSILAGHVIWAFDTCLMLSFGDLTRTANTLGIADYVNADNKVTPLSVWAETHHLWFIPTSLFLMWLTKTPFGVREVAYGSLWVAFVSMVTVLLIPRPCVPVVMKGRDACFKNNVNMNQYWWGLDDVKFLHAFDYAIGTPAMVTWVMHNFFYWSFNMVLWSLGKTMVKVLGWCMPSAPSEDELLLEQVRNKASAVLETGDLAAFIAFKVSILSALRDAEKANAAPPAPSLSTAAAPTAGASTAGAGAAGAKVGSSQANAMLSAVATGLAAGGGGEALKELSSMDELSYVVDKMLEDPSEE